MPPVEKEEEVKTKVIKVKNQIPLGIPLEKDEKTQV